MIAQELNILICKEQSIILCIHRKQLNIEHKDTQHGVAQATHIEKERLYIMTVLFMIKTEDKTTGEIHKRSVSVKAEKNENYIDLATDAVIEIEDNHPNEKVYQVFRLEEIPWKTRR